MENPSAKPRSDAWDADLSEAQRWQAYAQFRRFPWFEVSKWAAEQFGVDAPSRSALYRWAGRMRGQESAHRLEQAITAREEIGTLAASAGQSDASLIEAYKTMAADIAMRTGDSKAASVFTGMALSLAEAQRKRQELDLKARAQQTKDEQLKLAREKFEAAERRINDAKQVVGDAKLTDAERTARIREIFGM